MSAERPIKIAIAAMGGQGGGVLSDWIVDAAEHTDHFAQCTSVPGVAQRTGATVYYIEIFPGDQRAPVMALMPVPGDVDLVIAGELVEAGRAIVRGLVTPDRTTLITSTHRDYALTEKMAMSDGRVDSNRFIEAGRSAARAFIAFDMAALTEETGSVISSVLLGAVAGSGILPFSRFDFEDAVRRAGVAVDASLTGFAAGYERARADLKTDESGASKREKEAAPSTGIHPRVAALLHRVRTEFAHPSHETLINGVRRLIDFQDPDYAADYLDRLLPVQALDGCNGTDNRLTTETARCLALWMSFEDTIRIADLKIRAERIERCLAEVRARPDQIVRVTEFMHPRVEEICDTLPAPLGRLLLSTRPLRSIVAFFCRKGRRVHTTSLSGFLLLYVLSVLKAMRRRTLRYHRETAEISAWLDRVAAVAAEDRALALELVACQGLIKGYGDTRERGMRNFHSIVEKLDRVRRTGNPVATLHRLREAALADEQGDALRAELKQVA